MAHRQNYQLFYRAYIVILFSRDICKFDIFLAKFKKFRQKYINLDRNNGQNLGVLGLWDRLNNNLSLKTVEHKRTSQESGV